jgi:hypothetical protein
MEQQNENKEFINLIDKLNKTPRPNVYMIMTKMCVLLQNLHNRGICCFGACLKLYSFSLCKKTGDLFLGREYYRGLNNDRLTTTEQKKKHDKQQLIRLFKEIGEIKRIDVTKIQIALEMDDDDWNNVYSVLASGGILEVENVFDYTSQIMINSLDTQNNILLGDENTQKYVISFEGDHSFTNVFRVLRKTIKDVNKNNHPSHIVFLESKFISGDGPINQIMNDFLLTCVNQGIISAQLKTLQQPECYFNGKNKNDLIKPLLKRDSKEDEYLFNDDVNIYHVIGFVILYCLYHHIRLSVVVPLDTYILLCAGQTTLSNTEFIRQFFLPHIMNNIDLQIGKENLINMIIGALPIKNLIMQAFQIGPNEEKLKSLCIESLHIRSNISDSKNTSIVECAIIDDKFNMTERQLIVQWLQSLVSNDSEKQIIKIITGTEMFSDFFICKTFDQNDNDNGTIRIQVCSRTIILPQSLFKFDQNGKDHFKDYMNNYFSFAWLNSSSSYVFNTN